MDIFVIWMFYDALGLGWGGVARLRPGSVHVNLRAWCRELNNLLASLHALDETLHHISPPFMLSYMQLNATLDEPSCLPTQAFHATLRSTFMLACTCTALDATLARSFRWTRHLANYSNVCSKHHCQHSMKHIQWCDPSTMTYINNYPISVANTDITLTYTLW
jgi:hypothetical protein